MKKALVTGGAGFIGSHVASSLIEEGFFIVILDDFTTGQESNLEKLPKGRFEVIRDSVVNLVSHGERLKGIPVIFHLAAEVGNINSIENTLEDAQTNILGTIQVCEAARKWGSKIIYSSSSAIFGESKALPIRENHPCEPLSPYGLSKMAGEKYVGLYGAIHGVPYVCLRYFNAYGEGQLYNPYSNVIPIFIRKLFNNEPLTVYGDGLQTRDFIHVRDIARANIQAAASDVSRGIYNIGTGTSSSILELVKILREIHPNLQCGFQPFRAGEVRNSVADISLARKALGFVPTIDLKEGVTRYDRWLRSSLADELTRRGENA